jgi:hypothetical protein
MARPTQDGHWNLISARRFMGIRPSPIRHGKVLDVETSKRYPNYIKFCNETECQYELISIFSTVHLSRHLY